MVVDGARPPLTFAPWQRVEGFRHEGRFAVRVGDRGHPRSEHAALGQARGAARELSLAHGTGTVLDRADGWRETWRDGRCETDPR